jgi:hypothetical protein
MRNVWLRDEFSRYWNLRRPPPSECGIYWAFQCSTMEGRVHVTHFINNGHLAR